jgi:hypothetical protein
MESRPLQSFSARARVRPPTAPKEPTTMRLGRAALAAWLPKSGFTEGAVKPRWNGGLLVPVPPQNTSRTCPKVLGGCGHVSVENRKTQAVRSLWKYFVCGKDVGPGTHRSDSGATMRLRAVGILSLQGEEDVKRTKLRRRGAIHSAGLLVGPPRWRA